jgi:hypothetical protein
MKMTARTVSQSPKGKGMREMGQGNIVGGLNVRDGDVVMYMHDGIQLIQELDYIRILLGSVRVRFPSRLAYSVK